MVVVCAVMTRLVRRLSVLVSIVTSSSCMTVIVVAAAAFAVRVLGCCSLQVCRTSF